MADEKLIRDRAGSYHTEDGRFAVENDGRWNVRDDEEHDDLGLPRVMGPFATLREQDWKLRPDARSGCQ